MFGLKQNVGQKQRKEGRSNLAHCLQRFQSIVAGRAWQSTTVHCTPRSQSKREYQLGQGIASKEIPPGSSDQPSRVSSPAPQHQELISVLDRALMIGSSLEIIVINSPRYSLNQSDWQEPPSQFIRNGEVRHCHCPQQDYQAQLCPVRCESVLSYNLLLVCRSVGPCRYGASGAYSEQTCSLCGSSLWNCRFLIFQTVVESCISDEFRWSQNKKHNVQSISFRINLHQ